MGEVLTPEFITRLPLDPERILTGAVKADLEEVLVLGWEKSEAYPGDFYMAGSDADLAKALMLILRAQKHIMETLK